MLSITVGAFGSLAMPTVAPAIVEDLGGLALYGWIFSADRLGALAREYGDPIQVSDLTRFPDAQTRAVAREAYERYRYTVLAAALATGQDC